MVCPNFRSSIWCNSRSKEQLTVWSRMGVIASKKTKERTKQVQQTAAVVTALKSTSTKSNKVEPQPNKTSSKSTHVVYGGRRLSDEREGLNNCKDSLTYGLPELKDSDTAYNMSASGTTGYWDQANGGASGQSKVIPYFGAWYDRVEFEELCTICGKYTGKTVHPCRVCAKVFHEACLKKQGKLHAASEYNAFNRANTPDGWSCHKCEVLTTLLTEDEMQELIESFDRLDVNQDTQISQEEYTRYKNAQYKEIHHENMPSVLVKEAEQEFKRMDKDKTGTIDWWEFLNHESLKVLGLNRSQFQLIRMLSPREIQEARDIFHAFDKDEDGYINSYEVARGFGRWFGNLRVSDKGSDPKQSLSFGRGLDPKSIAEHVDHHTDIFMAADKDNNRLVSWEEYLREQALYILAGRPN